MAELLVAAIGSFAAIIDVGLVHLLAVVVVFIANIATVYIAKINLNDLRQPFN